MSAQKKSFATENHVLRAAHQAEVRNCSKTKDDNKISLLIIGFNIAFYILLLGS